LIKRDIGSLLKRLREQKRITQVELAEDSGIDRATISKIESGKSRPSINTLRALFEKLGYDLDSLENHYMSRDEIKLQKWKNELEDHLSNGRTEKSDELISNLESSEDFMRHNVNTQFILAAKASNKLSKNEDADMSLALLNKAMRVSIPLFAERYIEDYFLSNQDVWIINMMASIHFRNNDLERAISIMNAIKGNFDNHCVDINLKGKYYPTIICNLTKYLELMGRCEEAIKLCDIGVDVCRATDRFSKYHKIMFNKACCLWKLGRKDECEIFIREAHYACRIFNQLSDMKEIQHYAYEKLGVVL